LRAYETVLTQSLALAQCGKLPLRDIAVFSALFGFNEIPDCRGRKYYAKVRKGMTKKT